MEKEIAKIITVATPAAVKQAKKWVAQKAAQKKDRRGWARKVADATWAPLAAFKAA